MAKKFDSRPGEGANHDRKIALMRAATTAVNNKYNSGGGRKVGAYRGRAVSLASAESAEKLSGNPDCAERAKRFQDKAEEYRQLANCARSDETRSSYLSMAENCEGTAEQMYALARLRTSAKEAG